VADNTVLTSSHPLLWKDGWPVFVRMKVELQKQKQCDYAVLYNFSTLFSCCWDEPLHVY